MKIKGMSVNINDVASEFGIDQNEFRAFIEEKYVKGVDYEKSFGSISIDSERKKEIVNMYKENDPKFQEETKKQQALNAELSKILITSGFSFAGYKIVKYGGFISGDDSAVVCSNEGGFGILSDMKKVQDNFMKSLQIIRRNALIELKEAAYDMGCNAVIGVDFDYNNLELSFGNGFSQYLFSVTANGNAAIIKKE